MMPAPHRRRATILGLLLLPTLLSHCTTSRSTDRAPNVLIIVTDDQRASGTLQVMPQTRRWFQEGGTTFPNTFATTPLCCPARASIFTGRYAHNHGIQTRVLPGDGTISPEGTFQRSTVQRYLHEAGYRTALFGKYLNGWPVPVNPPYFDEWAVIRVPPGVSYHGGIVNLNGQVERMRQYNTSFIRDQAISFLRRTSPIGQPWFLYVAVKAPHEPFTAEPKYESAAIPSPRTNPAMEETDRSDKPPFVRTEPASHRKMKQLRELQLRTLISVDDMIGALFGELQRLGELDNTLAIFTSDNGISWGEHRLGGKLLPYTESVAVPLLLRWPGHVPAGGRDDRIAANIDLVPTILAASGIRPSSDLPVDGRSLLASSTRAQIFLEYWTWGSRRPIPDWASIRSRASQYTEYYDPAGRIIFREYYNLRRDRWQLTNLLRQGERPSDPEIQRLSRQLALARRCAGPSCLVVDQDQRSQVRIRLRA